jgi:riboflavin kinase / FMN adenylyltransferase
MRLVKGLDALPLSDGPSVVTVGFFDGVHRGHQLVLGRAVASARERGVHAAAVTFDRHPREVLTPGREPRLLTTVERRADLIREAGLDTLVVLAFTEELSRWPAQRFARVVLAEGLGAQHVVVGQNFTFGHRALGTLETLHELGSSLGFTAEGVGLLDIDGRRVSSSSVREALGDGELGWPRTALGRRFALDGDVVAGAGRGKDLGFPTANLRTRPRLLLPGAGIYAGRAMFDGRRAVAAISVGTNPTFGSEPLHAEAYLLDYEGAELRGRPMSLEFWAQLRDEERFESAEALSEAIASDVRRTRELVVTEDS